MRNYNTSCTYAPGYSIIASILLIGFLLVLASSTLSLVLSEMKDGGGRQDYMKAFYGAEAAQELALMKIKQEGYGYDENGNFTHTNILGSAIKTPEISYEFESKVSTYSGSLAAGESEIIPLFWIDDSGNTDSILTIDFDTSLNIAWNIIGQSSGESGVGNFSDSSPRVTKTLISGVVTGTKDFKADSGTIGTFLSTNPGSYLIIFNPSSSAQNFEMSSGQYFSLPKARIISSANVGKYTQNLETSVDNTKFLGILRYSIFSGN